MHKAFIKFILFQVHVRQVFEGGVYLREAIIFHGCSICSRVLFYNEISMVRSLMYM